MNKINKKYLIIGIVFILVILIGVTLAFYTSGVNGNNKNLIVTSKKIEIVYDDETSKEINSEDIVPGWEETKTFTIENKSSEVYYYNIIIKDMINGFTAKHGLQYKIESTDGYNMTEYEDVPQADENKVGLLAENIKIEVGPEHMHHYTIHFRYYDDPDIDQSEDINKSFEGYIYISDGEKPTLADYFAKKYPDATQRKHFDQVVGSNENTDGYDNSGVYYEEGDFTEDLNGDGKGERVYYWTGNVNGTKYDNWVKFANLYWRIIRTNEDGSLRLLYAGKTTDTTEGYVQGVRYNGSANDKRYVGYMYGSSGTLSNNRENTISSPIKSTIDSWYDTNIKNKSDNENNSYNSYISKTAIYCNDRANDNQSDTKYGMNYAGLQRLYINKRPSFKCEVKTDGSLYNDTPEIERKKDMFTGTNKGGKDGQQIGNGKLADKPVALITADEIVFAGGEFGVEASNVYYRLNSSGNSVTNNYWWWTMTPCYYRSSSAGIFTVLDGYYGNAQPGMLDEDYTTDGRYVRPVLSIKACANIEGEGKPTETEAYTFTIDEECAKADN